MILMKIDKEEEMVIVIKDAYDWTHA